MILQRRERSSLLVPLGYTGLCGIESRSIIRRQYIYPISRQLLKTTHVTRVQRRLQLMSLMCFSVINVRLGRNASLSVHCVMKKRRDYAAVVLRSPSVKRVRRFFDILLQNYFYYNCPSDSRRGVVLVACVCNFVTGKRKTRITRFRSGELCEMKSVSRCNRSTMSQTVCADAARHAVEINT